MQELSEVGRVQVFSVGIYRGSRGRVPGLGEASRLR